MADVAGESQFCTKAAHGEARSYGRSFVIAVIEPTPLKQGSKLQTGHIS